jgi:hypothetical protein
LVASKTDGALVRSLEDGSTRFVSSRQHSFSHLESIEVYTEADNVNLVEVFRAMRDSGETLPSASDVAATTAYFQKVFPQMDFQKVYNSDRKKMVRWSTILETAGVELKTNGERQQEMIAEHEAKLAAQAADGGNSSESSEENLPSTERPAEASTSGLAPTEAPAEGAAAPKPPRKAKAAAPKEPTAAVEDSEEAPKKKPARKKKSEDEAQ